MLMSRTAETLGPTVSLASNVTHEARTQTDIEKLDAQIERDRPWLVVRLSFEERPCKLGTVFLAASTWSTLSQTTHVLMATQY